MNNLNDPPRWNIQPDRRRGGEGPGGEGHQWNYALLVPMLGLAAFRWIWSRESQKEIQSIKAQYDNNVLTVNREMEARYRQTLNESCQAAALLELELEKERLKVKGYKQALVSQSQQLMEERKQLQRDREAWEQKKRLLVESGTAGAILQQALEKENAWHQRATAMLKDLEQQLVERQSAYCSLLLPRDQRLEMEKNMLLKVVREPIGGELDLEADLKDIFKKDTYCADLMNVDKRKNGRLMWLYLKYWELQVTVQKHRRAEEAILKGQTLSDTK